MATTVTASRRVWLSTRQPATPSAWSAPARCRPFVSRGTGAPAALEIRLQQWHGDVSAHTTHLSATCCYPAAPLGADAASSFNHHYRTDGIGVQRNACGSGHRRAWQEPVASHAAAPWYRPPLVPPVPMLYRRRRHRGSPCRRSTQRRIGRSDTSRVEPVPVAAPCTPHSPVRQRRRKSPACSSARPGAAAAHPHTSVSIAPLASQYTPAAPATRCLAGGIGSSWPVWEMFACRVEAEAKRTRPPTRTSQSIRNHPLPCAHSRLAHSPTARRADGRRRAL